MKQRQQKRTARTKPGDASRPASARTRRHFDAIPQVQHQREYHSGTRDRSDSTGGAEPDEEDLEIAMVSRPAKILLILEFDTWRRSSAL
jgi:hypothetical protein